MARLLMASKYYHPFRGGIEDNARSVAIRLARDHEVVVLAFQHDRRAPTVAEVIDGVTVRRARTPMVLKSQPLSLAYALALVRTPADLIYFHAPNVLGSAALLVRLAIDRRVRLVTMHHMDMYGRPALRLVARWLYDRVLRRSDRLIVTSVKNAAVSRDIRVPVDPVAIPLGISPEAFEMTAAERAAAHSWRRELIAEAPMVAFVGRHARYKGLDVLVRALAELPDVHCVLGGDGPHRAAAQSLAASLGIAGRTHFLGQVDHATKLRVLAAADVFAFPSTEITEAFGVSQLEAMLVGAPVVASDLPTGVTDVAVHDETALLVPPGDPHALALAIRDLLDHRATASRLSASARGRVLDVFTTAQMADRNLVLVDAVLRERLA